MVGGCDNSGCVSGDDAMKLCRVLSRKGVEPGPRGALTTGLQHKLAASFARVVLDEAQRPDVAVLFSFWSVDELGGCDF